MNPPIRDASHRDALWAAIADRTVDILGSDHAPHTLEEKAKAYPQSPSGMPGVQTLVPIMLDHVDRGRLSLERFVELSSHRPAELFGIAGKGRISEGHDADVSIVDMKAERTITDDWIESRCRWTPYDGSRSGAGPSAPSCGAMSSCGKGRCWRERQRASFAFRGHRTSKYQQNGASMSDRFQAIFIGKTDRGQTVELKELSNADLDGGRRHH